MTERKPTVTCRASPRHIFDQHHWDLDTLRCARCCDVHPALEAERGAKERAEQSERATMERFKTSEEARIRALDDLKKKGDAEERSWRQLMDVREALLAAGKCGEGNVAAMVTRALEEKDTHASDYEQRIDATFAACWRELGSETGQLPAAIARVLARERDSTERAEQALAGVEAELAQLLRSLGEGLIKNGEAVGAHPDEEEKIEGRVREHVGIELKGVAEMFARAARGRRLESAVEYVEELVQRASEGALAEDRT